MKAVVPERVNNRDNNISIEYFFAWMMHMDITMQIDSVIIPER